MRKRTAILVLGAGLAVALPIAVALAAPGGSGKDKDKAGAPPDARGWSQMTMKAGKGRLGISLLELSPELRAHLGAPRDRGVLVNTVRPDSPAARAGVSVGDVVVEVDGDRADSAGQILRAMSDRKKGDAVSVVVVRQGKQTTLKARMEDDPSPVTIDVDPDGWRGLDKGFQFGAPGDSVLRRDLERAQKRLQELERRLERLEHPR